MPIIKTVYGDILDAVEKYVCQQCNCNTIKAHGLSRSIADKYYWANPYCNRRQKSNNSTSEPDEPGTILELRHPTNPDNYPVFLCMMAQWCPGKPGAYKHYYSTTYDDTYENRKEWFSECLAILDEKKYGVVAMPYYIGCGLAGGIWSDYEKMLNECETNIVLYKK